MSKYIIKNCPAMQYYTCEKYGMCKDCTDCVMKQIYETCIEYHKNCEIKGNCIDDRTCTSCFFGGGNELAQDILQLLQIDEVE